jgi:hypothetical protein
MLLSHLRDANGRGSLQEPLRVVRGVSGSYSGRTELYCPLGVLLECGGGGGASGSEMCAAFACRDLEKFAGVLRSQCGSSSAEVHGRSFGQRTVKQPAPQDLLQSSHSLHWQTRQYITNSKVLIHPFDL